mmetsp:Transcript_25129/g.65344  ORF Transcript_25129/g.65344 Transcript_25129/m.65344 type:complete len:233 (-) Transcript_25129:452-1150(-)
MPPTPAPAAELPNVMPPRLPWTRSMVSAEPAESSVMPPTPAPAAELPKVMPLEDSPTRSIVPDDPCMSIEPRSARACRSFCSSVHTRVFFVAYLFLPKTGTATPWAWHRPPRDSSVLSTSFRQSPSSKSFLAPKQSDAGMPMAWQPLRNMLMLSICRKAMVDSETFLTLPGLIALISLHSRTPVFRFARKLSESSNGSCVTASIQACASSVSSMMMSSAGHAQSYSRRLADA